MKNILVALGLLLCLGIFANKIVYPGGSCPTIVKSGNNMDILYDNSSMQTVDSVILEGPFNRVVLSKFSVNKGKYEYDNYTQAHTNNKISVNIPSNIPEELYNLVIKSGKETSISKKSVKVVKEFRKTHRFIHMSDPHISRQWEGTPENGYAKELELLDRFIEVANIISPDFIMVTGDLIHDYTRMNADSVGWGGYLLDRNAPPLAEEKYRNYFEGTHGLSGIYGFNSPTFSTTGNHDFYAVDKNDSKGKCNQWNSILGKRVYGFSYGDTRIIASDDFLGDSTIDKPQNAYMSGLQGKMIDAFLKENGSGKLRIWAKHSPKLIEIDTMFMDKNDINLIINGHSHVPKQDYIGKRKVVSIRPGAVCRSGEVAHWKKTLGFFRIITIDGDTFEYSEPLRFCKDPTLPCKELDLNLQLNYKKTNDGSFDSNEATITNRFGIDLPSCKVRFVMPKGKYKVSEGTVFQTIESGKYSIVDVCVNVKADSKQKIQISHI